MESREKKKSDPTEDDGDPNLDEEDVDADPSLDSLGRPVSGSRRTHGANIGLVHDKRGTRERAYLKLQLVEGSN